MSRIADAALAIQEWAVLALTGSADLRDALGLADLSDIPARLYDSPPGPDATLPYVDITVSEPRDVGTVPMVEVMASGLLTVKLVGQEEAYDPLGLAYEAVHAALQGKKDVALSRGGTMLTCYRLRMIAYPEQSQGVEYRHLGGTYAVTVQ